MTARRGPRKDDPPGDIFISREAGWKILVANVQRLLSMSAKEFIRRWDSGGLK